LKALLVCLNAKFVHASAAPFCLLAGIRSFGRAVRDAEILEGTVNEDAHALLLKILAHRPDFIGFSCYIWNIGLVLSLAERLRNAGCRAKICLGGPEVSSRGEGVLRSEPSIDFVLGGEGERSLPRLLDALATGEKVTAVPSLTYRDGEEIRFTHAETVSLPPPSPLSAGYAACLHGRIAYYETSRGCPFHCSFCLSGQKGGCRFFDASFAISELICLANSKTRTVKLVDRTFNADRDRAKQIWRALIDGYGVTYPPGVTFHFEIEASLLDEESLLLLQDAPKGLFQFEIGLQSTNPETLDAIGRPRDYGRILSAESRLVGFGNLTVHLDLIAGLPFETYASFTSGFHEAYATRPHMLQLGFLKLLHGTKLRDDADRFGICFEDTAPYTVWKTDTLSAGELEEIRLAETAFDRLYNSGRHRRTLAFLHRELKVTPYELFLLVGRSLSETPAAGLDALTERLLSLFAPNEGELREKLIDAMLADRLATNPNRYCPPFLSRFDRRIAALRAQNKGKTRKNFALLSDRTILEATVSDRDPVTGEFSIRILQSFEMNGECHAK
jgi:hypothetical protein